MNLTTNLRSIFTSFHREGRILFGLVTVLLSLYTLGSVFWYLTVSYPREAVGSGVVRER